MYGGEDMEARFPATIDAREISIVKTEDIKNAILEKKRIEEEYSTFTSQLLKSMEENNILSYKDDNITISYISESESISLDTEKLKEKYPEVYNDCLVVKHKNSSVRILAKKKN
jgi:hypothetical protein